MKLPRALAAPGLAVLLLTGCAGHAGVAALVDSEPITQADLARTVQDFRSVASEAPTPSVLQALIVTPFWLQAAADAGFGTSRQEGVARLEELAGQAGVAEPSFGPGIVGIAQVTLAQQKAVEAGRGAELAEAADALVRQAQIEVSPRFGEWSGEGLGDVSRPWLLEPVPAG